MRNRKKYFLAVLTVSLGAMVLSGCGLNKKPKETEPETVKLTESEKITETETETEETTETEADVAYTSTDKSIKIILPDSTWKVTQDVDEMRVFSSGAAMINIVHAANESERKKTTVAESEEELKASLTRQYPDANAFEIESFEKLTSETLNTYEYVVKYNSTSMWAYAITYGIMAEDQAYVVTGTVTDDNRTLLEAVKKSVESFTVLQNPTFTSMPGNTAGTENTTGQSETQTQSESSDGTVEGELATLQEYAANATLYASDSVNIRTEPSTENDENIIGSLNPGSQVTVIGETSQWFKVNINGNIGYVSKQFLVSTAPSGQNTETEKQTETNQSGTADVTNDEMLEAEYGSQIDYGTSQSLYATAEVNMRTEPGMSGTIVDSLTSGAAVNVIGETDNWFVVSVNGTKAYVSKAYLSYSNTSTNGGDGNTDGSGSTDGNGTTDGNGNTGGNGTTDGNGNTGGNGTTDGNENTGGNGTTDGNENTEGSGTNDGNGTANGGDNAANGTVSTISGTITSTNGNTAVIEGDDGNTYTVDYSNASVGSGDLYEGMYVSANVGSSNTSGNALVASSITGYQ